MLRPGDHIWAGVGQSPLLVAHEREDLPSRALRPLRLPNQDFVLHYQGKYYTTAVKTLTSGIAILPCARICLMMSSIMVIALCYHNRTLCLQSHSMFEIVL